MGCSGVHRPAGADLALAIDQQLYPALLPLVQRFARDNHVKVALQEGTCGVAAGLAPRLLLGGTLVAALLWGVLDIVHSSRIEQMARAELVDQLHDDAHFDRLRFDASVRAISLSSTC